MKPYCVLISLLTYHFTVNFYDPFPIMHMTLTELVFARSGYLGEQRGERSKRNKKISRKENVDRTLQLLYEEKHLQ